MPWHALSLDVSALRSEDAQVLLQELGAEGLEVRDGDWPMPNVRQPKAGEAIVIGFFPDAQKARAARDQLKALKPTRVELEGVEERDWSTEWRSQIKSVRVGRLWVGPPWETPPKDAVALIIEPKMAFGTGDHPTTSLCLAAVDDFMQQHPRASVLDVGTGTGVLGFAAKKLGAERVIGTDNDPVAIEIAKETAAVNGVGDVELSTKELSKVPGTFDLVLANILANTLIQLSPLIAPKVGKKLVLAGVLVPQAKEVRAAFEKLGLKPDGEQVQGEWIRLDFVKPAAAAPKTPKPPKKKTVKSRAVQKLAAGPKRKKR